MSSAATRSGRAASARRNRRTYFWAPDSSQILFLKDESGSEDFLLYGASITGGAPRSYTPFSGTRVEIIAISPEVKHAILIGMNRRNPRWHDAYRLDLTTGELTEVWRNPDAYESIVADRMLRPVLGRRPLPDGGAQIDRIGPAGPTRSLMRFGLADAQTTTLGVRADGMANVLSSVGEDKSVLALLDPLTGNINTVARDPRADVSAVIENPRTGAAEAFRATYRTPHWVGLTPQMRRDIAVLDREARGSWTLDSQSDDGSKWIVWIDRISAPPAYYMYDRGSRRLTKLFDVRPELAGYQLGVTHPLEIPARDGLKLVSYLLLPPGSDPDGDGVPSFPVPLVLNVHGGPWSRDGFNFSGYNQWLANRGYAVLTVNFRGSTGFGKRFLNAGNLEWGRGMQQDLYDAVDYLVSRRVTTADRTAILGTSYGGYATLVALSTAPERFRCGVDVVGPSNLLTLMATIPAYWVGLYSQFTQRMGDPSTPDGRALLTERSPLTHAAGIRAPLLIGQGANDPRVNRAESDQIVAAAKARGLPITYLLYPDEGHGFARPENRASFNAVTEQFLASCLGGSAEPIGDALSSSSVQVLERGNLALP